MGYRTLRGAAKGAVIGVLLAFIVGAVVGYIFAQIKTVPPPKLVKIHFNNRGSTLDIKTATAYYSTKGDEPADKTKQLEWQKVKGNKAIPAAIKKGDAYDLEIKVENVKQIMVELELEDGKKGWVYGPEEALSGDKASVGQVPHVNVTMSDKFYFVTLVASSGVGDDATDFPTKTAPIN